MPKRKVSSISPGVRVALALRRSCRSRLGLQLFQLFGVDHFGSLCIFARVSCSNSSQSETPFCCALTSVNGNPLPQVASTENSEKCLTCPTLQCVHTEQRSRSVTFILKFPFQQPRKKHRIEFPTLPDSYQSPVLVRQGISCLCPFLLAYTLATLRVARHD